jgi:parallel beta-helix repeat protein
MLLLAGSLAHATDYFVAPTGDDANPGTRDQPWRTPHHAIEAVKPGDTILLRAGEYDLSEPLVITPERSGLTVAAAPGETVTLRGSRAITGWQLWRDGIYRADLAAQGLAEARFHQLFHRGARMPLARYPNLDPEHPRTGGFVYVEDKAPRPFEQFIYAEGDIPFDDWSDISQAEIWTVFGYGWNFAITPVTEVDREQRIITVRRVRRHFERMNRYFIQNVLGALDAPGEWFLDYATDTLYFRPPDDGPPGGSVRVPVLDNIIEVRGSLPYPHEYLKTGFRGGRADASLPEDAPADEPVEGVTIRGLRIEHARQSGIVLRGASECAVIGCAVSGIGNMGINLGGVCNAHEEVGNPRVVPAEGFSGGVGGGGQNILFNDPCVGCRVEGCDVSDCGADGIFLYGTGNVAENNHVRNIGLLDKDCACVSVWGEENVARRNSLHDVPRNAVFLKGIGNVVELNDLRWTMLETCDGGAIRMCQRNLTLRGNVIRHNRIVDSVGYGYPRNAQTFQSPYYAWGVYLDDFTCGTTVAGNIIVRTSRGGVMLHGGSDNTVAGNVVVDGGLYALEHAPIRDRPVTGNVFASNVLVFDGNEAVAYRCTKWLDGALAITGNIVWPRGAPARVDTGYGGQVFEDWDAWMTFGADDGSIVREPLLTDPEGGDFMPSPDSPAWALGFEEIPVALIGCYEDPARASWPVDMDAGEVREQPLLYTQPTLPLREDFEIDVVGRKPRHGDAMADGAAKIIVTDEQAASGEHSLKFVDAPGLRATWLPRIFYPLDHREGRVRFSCDLRC